MKHWIILSLLLFTACAHNPCKLKVQLPEIPKMREVIVKEQTIEGESVDNVVKNVTDLWEHVYRLRALLGEK